MSGVKFEILNQPRLHRPGMVQYSGSRHFVNCIPTVGGGEVWWLCTHELQNGMHNKRLYSETYIRPNDRSEPGAQRNGTALHFTGARLVPSRNTRLLFRRVPSSLELPLSAGIS